MLKICRKLDRKPARQCSLPIDKVPVTISLFVLATPNKNTVHLELAAQQMLPAVPAWIPRNMQKDGINPKFQVAAHITADCFIGVEIAIA